VLILRLICASRENHWALDEKDIFHEKLKEEQRSNEAPGKPKEAGARRHGRAWCCTIVLQ